MKNWKQSPENPLIAKYIDCYWFVEKTSEGIGVDYPLLNPDPCGHLILAQANQQYRYQFNNADIEGRGTHLILPNTSSITMDHSKAFAILGIKFHLGALYSLKFEADFPLSNTVVNNTKFLPFELVNIINNPKFLSEAVDPIKLTSKRLDEVILPWVQRNREDKHSQLVRQAISIFKQTPLSEMGSKLGYSQRTIERAFLRVTGLTLKQFESMTRFESLITYLYKRKDSRIDWADVAIQFGYSDQPHLIRYLKSTIGASPKVYLRQRNITIDVYGDFEE